MLIWFVLPKLLAEIVLLLRRTHETVRDIVRLFASLYTLSFSSHLTSSHHVLYIDIDLLIALQLETV